MRAVVWHGGPNLSLEEVDPPGTDDGEVVFQVRLAGICGSDLHPYRGHHGPRKPPLILGHEAVGTVVGRRGRFVLFPLVACGECRACRAGDEHLCEQRGLVGLDRPGVFAEQARVREDALVPVPETLDDRIAVLVEPLATAVAALRIEQVGSGTDVLVLGAGPIGLLAIHAARSLGATVTAVEPLPHRRELARQFGAGDVLADSGDVAYATADVAIDAVGVTATWTAGIRAVRSGGTVTIIGLGETEGVLPVGELVRRGIKVRGHYAYLRWDFDHALRLLTDDPPPLEWLSVLPIEQAAEAFRRLVEEPDSATKVLLAVGHEDV